MQPSPNESKTVNLRTYVRSECVVFHTTRDEFGGLSNMASGFPLSVNGISIRTSEALYQVCRFPHRPDVQQFIIDEASPMIAKRKSKPYRDETRSDWDLVRHKIMRWSLRVKLARHYSTFGELLLSTGERDIVEQSSKDNFWGAFVRPDGTLIGQNILGRLLMELRERLKYDESQSLKIVEPLSVPDFFLLGREIEIVDATNDPTQPQQSRLL
ncbi:NADAR family protein [Janthinobacterium agaricidamnosum]|nr:NADAR family protein [Janthinobacterium agaricidamnosum]